MPYDIRFPQLSILIPLDDEENGQIDNALKAGETATVTLVFSEVVSGFSSSDDITVVNGSLTTITSSDNII